MPTFKFVKAGDRIEIPSAEFHNAIVELLNQSTSFARGVYDKQGSASEVYKSVRRPIYVRANADIDEYSIFTITGADTHGTGSGSIVGTGTGTHHVSDMQFDWRYPKVFTKQVTDTNTCVLLVNKAVELAIDGDYFLDILGDEWPALVSYDSTDGIPTIGDEVGVKPNTYKVALGYTGLFVVSGPELYDEKVVWVVRAGGTGAASDEYIGKVVQTDILSMGYGVVEEHREFWVGTGTFYDVFNPHDVDLELGLKVRWRHYPGWDDWIVEPWEFIDCEPAGTGTP